jgi:nitronate monooxygenase
MNFAARFPWASLPLLVGAPMRVMSGPELAVAVSAAGGLGFLGPNTSTDKMEGDLKQIQQLAGAHPRLKRYTEGFSKGSASRSNLPVGVGFQLWSDDLKIATRLMQQYRPAVAWLYAPNEEVEFANWSEDLRNASPGIQIWIQIGTVGEVHRLLEQKIVPNVFIVQGAEAGGHGRAEDGMGVISLVPEVVDLLRQKNVSIPVIAAGGIADGRGAAAALCLGAQGVAMGTRFLAATEARISKGYQQEVVRASDAGTSTKRTLLYNHLRGTYGWPKPYAPRTIINRSFLEHQTGASFEQLKELHNEAVNQGDEGWGPSGRLATYAGGSIGLIKSIKSAKQIISETRAGINSAATGLHDSFVGQPKL